MQYVGSKIEMINSTNESHFDIQKSIAENEVCYISQFFLTLLLYHPLGQERMACSFSCTLTSVTKLLLFGP